jgi:Zn-dependent protease with chaperone function
MAPQQAVLRASWYDGRKAQAQPTLVWLEPGPEGPRLHWHPIGAPAALSRSSKDVDWPELFSVRRQPQRLTIDLRDQGSLELDDVQGWYAAFGAAGARHSLAERMQTRWRTFLSVLLLSAAVIFAFYRWGTPWAATHVTKQVPVGWELNLSDEALRDMDKRWFEPSKLPPARQAELRARFEALAGHIAPPLQRYAGYTPRLQLHFRRGLGANAMALPGGIVVMTDGMVEAAARLRLADDALVGVLAHEIGHVLHRHTTRMLVEQGVLNVGLGLALGDVSWVMSTGASLLTGLAYRRSHETEADCFAVALMRKAQLPTEPMADLLLHLESAAGGGHASPRKESGGAGIATLLSSHPDTGERAHKLKLGDHGTCH